MMTSIFASDNSRSVCITLYRRENNGESIGTTIWLSPERAREIGAELIDAASAYPRVASAADLGLERVA